MKNIKDKLKFIGYEAFKLVVFAILLSFIIPNVNAEGWTLLYNMTFEAGNGISIANNFTCTANAGSWAITTTECNTGNCLRYGKGSSAAYGDCRIKSPWGEINPAITYKINFWGEDEFNGGGGYVMVGHENTSSTLHQEVGWQVESDRAVRVQNSTTQSNFQNMAAMAGDTQYWTVIIMNATSNYIGMQICTDASCSSSLYKNWTMLQYQNYQQSWLSFVGYRDVNYDDVEFWYYDTTPPPPPATIGRLTADALNGMDLSTINIFNVTVKQRNGVLNGTYAVTNGLLNISLNPAYLYNITGYFSNFLNRHTLKLVNISNSQRFYLWESEARFTGRELYTNTSITGFTVYNNYLSNSSTPPRLYFNNGTYNLTANKTLYQNARKTITRVELQNNTQNFTFYKYINVTAYNGKTGAKISGLNVTVRNTALGVLQNNYTTGNQFLIPVGVSTWNITVYNNSFARNFGNSKLITLNSSSYATTKLRFDLFTTNSFDITFKDEQTLNNITGTKIFIDLIGEIYSANYSTTTGNLYADLLTPDTYTIRYYGSGYQPRTSTYTLTDTTYNQITLYLLSASSNVSLYVLDDTRQPVEAAQIKVYRYSVIDNAYILVNTINTDYEGKAIIDAQKNSEFYRFYIYHNGELKLSTQPAYITSSEIVFTISTRAGIMEDFFRNEVDYTYSCDYNIVTRNFKFYYDTQGEGSQGCLYLYTVSPNGFTTDYNSTCTASESSTILLRVANTSGVTYLAKGYITVNGDTDLLCTNSYSFINNAFVKSYGNFLIIFMVILFATIGFFSLPMAFILTPVPLVFGSALGLISVPMAASVGMCVLGVALAVVIQRRG